MRICIAFVRGFRLFSFVCVFALAYTDYVGQYTYVKITFTRLCTKRRYARSMLNNKQPLQTKMEQNDSKIAMKKLPCHPISYFILNIKILF